MKKIPTLFARDPDDRGRVLPQITPGCEWALTDPAARATRKYDGTCVMFDDRGRWWSRREVKADREAPVGWWEVDSDPVTGKRTGWEPVEQSSFARWHAQALSDQVWANLGPGTYELVGPKVNGNPERLGYHVLLRHSAAESYPLPAWLSPVNAAEAFGALEALLLGLKKSGIEGLVWHHPDGRMAKLKGRDFR